MNIALFHFHVTQIKRSAGQSAVAAAAYRAGEKLHSEYYGEDSDYTRKGGVICSEILLPSHAPPEYADRETLWNAVEKAERGKKAQLAYSFDIALQNEFSMQENIALARQFLLENFVSRGMVVDFAVHSPDKEDVGISNPHFHVMCPIRPLDEHGRWGNKQRREYEHTQGWLAVNQDMGILSLERVQILPQDGLSAHGVHQGDLHAGELDVCGHQVNALRVVQDTLAGAQRLVHQDTAHRVGQGKGQLVRLGVAQADGQAALRVPVDQQHFLSGLRQPNPQVRAGGCLANAAFLVGDGDDLRVQ